VGFGKSKVKYSSLCAGQKGVLGVDIIAALIPNLGAGGRWVGGSPSWPCYL